MKISELAKKCGYEFVGEDRNVDSVLYSRWAGETSIAVIKNRPEIEKTMALCVLTKPIFVVTHKTLLYASDAIEVAAVKVAEALLENGEIKTYSCPKYKKVSGYYSGENVIIAANSVISPNVYIGDDVCIGNNCFIEPDVNIGSGTVIKDNVYIASGSTIGAKSFYHYYEHGLKEFSGIGITIIDDDVNVGNHTTIQRGAFSNTYIGKGCKIGNLIDIGHDVYIENNCKIVSQTGIASNVYIGNHVQIFGQVCIANNVRIGNFATVMAKSLVTKNVLTGKTVSGIYAREHIEELKFQAKIRR